MKPPALMFAFHFTLMSEQGSVDGNAIYADAQKAGLDLIKLRAGMVSPEVDKAIAASHDLATKVKIDGTPTFIINGVMHPGAVDDAALVNYSKES